MFHVQYSVLYLDHTDIIVHTWYITHTIFENFNFVAYCLKLTVIRLFKKTVECIFSSSKLVFHFKKGLGFVCWLF